MGQKVHLRFQDLQALYHMPIEQAARRLGVSRPTISRTLRRHGVKRWPFRKVQAVMKRKAREQERRTTRVSTFGEETEHEGNNSNKLVVDRFVKGEIEDGSNDQGASRTRKKEKVKEEDAEIPVDRIGMEINERMTIKNKNGGVSASPVQKRSSSAGPLGFVRVNKGLGKNCQHDHHCRGRLLSPVALLSPIRLSPVRRVSSRPSSRGTILVSRTRSGSQGSVVSSKASVSPDRNGRPGHCSRSTGRQIVNSRGEVVGQRIHSQHPNGDVGSRPVSRKGVNRALQFDAGGTARTPPADCHHRPLSSSKSSVGGCGTHNRGMHHEQVDIERAPTGQTPILFALGPLFPFNFSTGGVEDYTYDFNEDIDAFDVDAVPQYQQDEIGDNHQQDQLQHNSMEMCDWKDPAEEDMYVWWPPGVWDGSKHDNHCTDCGNFYPVSQQQGDIGCACNESPGRKLKRSESDPTLPSRGRV